MTELPNANASPMATDKRTARVATTTDAPQATTDASGWGIRLIRWLVVINLGLVALQALSAGFILSGYERALTAHSVVAHALQLGALLQAVAAVVLWRHRCLPLWVGGVSIGLFVIVFLEVVLGYNQRYWLHVPIGVGILGGLTLLVIRLETLWRPTGARS